MTNITYFLIYLIGYVLSYFMEKRWHIKAYGEWNDRYRNIYLLTAIMSWFNVFCGICVYLIDHFDKNKFNNT